MANNSRTTGGLVKASLVLDAELFARVGERIEKLKREDPELNFSMFVRRALRAAVAVNGKKGRAA